MTATSQAKSTASRAANSKPLEYLARGGFVAYGVIHLLFAWLALQVAFGKSAESDQSGALQTVAQQPGGKFLLILIIVGMFAMALWQLFEAIVGESGQQGKEAIVERVTSGIRTILYGYFGFLGIKVLSGANASQGDSQQSATSSIMDNTGGRWLIGFVGLVVIGVGVGLAIYGYKKKFMEKLNTGQMHGRIQQTVQRLGMAGYGSKGIAYAIVGVLIISAAWTYDAEKARGMDGALKTVASAPWGPWMLGLIALGIACFGVYCFFQARYRKV